LRRYKRALKQRTTPQFRRHAVDTFRLAANAEKYNTVLLACGTPAVRCWLPQALASPTSSREVSVQRKTLAVLCVMESLRTDGNQAYVLLRLAAFRRSIGGILAIKQSYYNHFAVRCRRARSLLFVVYFQGMTHTHTLTCFMLCLCTSLPSSFQTLQDSHTEKNTKSTKLQL